MIDNGKGKKPGAKKGSNNKPSSSGKEGRSGNGKADKTPEGLSYEFYCKLKAVARLRVEGATWAQIAIRYRYKTAESARIAITSRNAKVWNKHYDQCLDDIGDECTAESVLTLRALQRDVYDADGVTVTRTRDDTVKRTAANSLLLHFRSLKMIKERKGGDVNVTVPVSVQAGERKEGEGEGDPIERLARKLEERRRLGSSKS